MEVMFSVNPNDVEKSSLGLCGSFGCWDMLGQKIWIWLFNYRVDDTIIERLSYAIEHEWLHELFARNVSYDFSHLAHWIIWHQQSWRLEND